MAENTTRILQPITPDEHRNIRLQPDTIYVPEIPHSVSADTHQALGSPTNIDSQNAFWRNTVDSSMANPIEHENVGPQDPSYDLAQTDNIPESPTRRSTTSIQSPLEIPTDGTEAPASTILEPLQLEPKRGWRETIGVWGCAVIAGGSVFVFLILGFIYFLWLGGGTEPEAATASRPWRNIILSGRAVQAITISALLLRVVVSAQAVSCTSLFAALFLERRAVLVSQLPYFSVARATNDGPRALLQMIIGSGTRHMLFTIETLLMLVMALAMLGLQFSSTILLTDLRTRMVVRNKEPILLNHSISNWTTVYIPALYDVSLATFGEAPSGSTAQIGAWGVSDTGLKQRALLPLEYPENRTMVRSYEGPIIVANSRVACMPPVLDGIISNTAPDGPGYFGVIDGTLDYNASFPIGLLHSTLPACQESGCEPLKFRCDVAAPVFDSDGYQSSLCFVGPVGGDYWAKYHGPRWNGSDPPWVRHTPIYLVLSTNTRSSDWEIVEPKPLVPTRQYNEWVSLELFPNRYVNISMCFVSFNMVDANISMTASAPLFEPKSGLAIPESNGDRTESYRRLLGSDLDRQSHKERGILTIDDPKNIPLSSYPISNNDTAITNQATERIEEFTYFTITNNFAITPEGVDSFTTFVVCIFCTGHGLAQPPQITATFTDTINHTGRAALAMDSWLFTIMQASHNKLFQYFDTSEETSISFTTVAQAPGRCGDKGGCRGLIAVSLLILIHVICVACTTALYLTKTQCSRYGNIWHTISQLHCDELDDVLLKANNAKDGEIEKLVRESFRNHLMRITVTADGSRIRPTKFGDDPNILSKNHATFTKMRARVYHFFRNPFVPFLKRGKKDAQTSG